MTWRVDTQTKVVKGITLTYPEHVYPGYHVPDWSQPKEEWAKPTGPNQNPYPTATKWHEPRKLLEAGEVFIPSSILEELQERDNSWGSGDAYLIPYSTQGWALECANLATQETRGGYYTTPGQKAAIAEVLREIHPEEGE